MLKREYHRITQQPTHTDGRTGRQAGKHGRFRVAWRWPLIYDYMPSVACSTHKRWTASRERTNAAATARRLWLVDKKGAVVYWSRAEWKTGKGGGSVHSHQAKSVENSSSKCSLHARLLRTLRRFRYRTTLKQKTKKTGRKLVLKPLQVCWYYTTTTTIHRVLR